MCLCFQIRLATLSALSYEYFAIHFQSKKKKNMIYGVNLNLLLDLVDPSCNMLQLQLKNPNYDDQHMGSIECIFTCGVSACLRAHA